MRAYDCSRSAKTGHPAGETKHHRQNRSRMKMNHSRRVGRIYAQDQVESFLTSAAMSQKHLPPLYLWKRFYPRVKYDFILIKVALELLLTVKLNWAFSQFRS